MLLSFKGKEELKAQHLASIFEWLKRKNYTKSEEEIAKEIFNPFKINKPSECILENYEDFPAILGLPIWLGNLLLTINHTNSNDFSDFKENYKVYFYPAFLNSCKVGVDYSLMFHEWELMILTEMLPKQERNKKYFLDLIELHKDALSGKGSANNKWIELQNEIDNLLQNINDFTDVPTEVGLKELELFENLETVKKNNGINFATLQKEAFEFQRFRKSYRKIILDSGRVAFLSIDNFIKQQELYTASSEALVDALLEEYININKKYDNKFEEEFRSKVWFELMEKLLKMLNEWE